MVPDLCVEEYIVTFFRELNIRTKQVVIMDPTLMRFTELQSLNLSMNLITRLENLPPNLKFLYLNGNNINEIGLSMSRPINSLVHLGLARNQIKQTALTHIVKVFPNLFCLDVSFNNFDSIESTVNWCMKLPKLTMLSLEGNPLILS